jgi:hypothetical protein
MVHHPYSSYFMVALPRVFTRIHEHLLTTRHNPPNDTTIISFNTPTTLPFVFIAKKEAKSCTTTHG